MLSPRSSAAGSATPVQPEQPLSILLVDDDPLFLEVMGALARSAFPNSEIVTTCETVQVSRLCEQRAFDCVVIDYRMPGEDGLSCAKRLRAQHPFLPLVLATGAGDEVLATRALQSGVTDYLPKSRLDVHTLRRSLERAIGIARQGRIIASQSAELELFAHALAHDFKQPVRQIVTFSHLLSEQLESAAPDVRNHLGFMSDAAKRLLELIAAMQQYVLLGRNPATSMLNLRTVVAETCDDVDDYISEIGGAVSVKSDGMFAGNAAVMRQVFQNLIINGLKYNISQKPTVEIYAEFKVDKCEITIRDNGIGIEQEYQESIFTPLLRLHPAAQFSGSGIGLAIVRKALTAQQGTVECRSRPGQGASFVMTLPAG